MQRLKDYITNNNNITVDELLNCQLNEGLWDNIKEWASKFTKWIFNIKDKDIDPNMPIAYRHNDFDYANALDYYKKHFERDNIKPQKKITSINEIKQIIKTSGADAKNGAGFSHFNHIITVDPNFNKINSSPYYINYSSFLYKDGNVGDIAGLAAWSVKYHVPDEDVKYSNYMRIFKVETKPTLRGHDLLPKYLSTLKSIAKENNCNGFIIYIKEENKSVIPIFERNDFKEVNSVHKYYEHCLVRTFNDY